MPRIKRPFWVAEQIETAIFEASAARLRYVGWRHRANKKIVYSPTVEFLGRHTAFVGGSGAGKTRSMKELVYFAATRSALGRAANDKRLTLAGQIVFDVHGEYGGHIAECAVIYKPSPHDAVCFSRPAEAGGQVMKPDCNQAVHEIVDLVQAGRLVTVDLSALKQDIQRTCTDQIVSAILDDAMERFSRGSPTNLIQMYFEEAHNLFRHGSDKDCAFLYERLAREGRKFRIGICYATQFAGCIPNGVLSNTYNLIEFPHKQLPRLRNTPPSSNWVPDRYCVGGPRRLDALRLRITTTVNYSVV